MKKSEIMTGRQVACPDCPLRTQKCFRQFGAPELEFIDRFKVGELVVDPGTSVLLEGIDSPHLGARPVHGRNGDLAFATSKA